MRVVETKTAEQHQDTLEQLSQRIDDMRTRRVWGRFILHFQDGVIVRLTREENERVGDDTAVAPIHESFGCRTAVAAALNKE